MSINDKKIIVYDKDQSDIIRDIRTLATSYTPEWTVGGVNGNPDDADALGSIAWLFSWYEYQNVSRFNQVFDRYHMEFVNLLDISVKGPRPAKGIVTLDLSASTEEGVFIPKGTRVEGVDEDGNYIGYETEKPIYVTKNRLDMVFMTNGENGQVYPICGDIKEPELLNKYPEAEPSGEVFQEGESGLKPFSMFGFDTPIGKNALLIYHKVLLNGRNSEIYIRFTDGNGKNGIVSDILSGKKYFAYPSEGGLKRINDFKLLEDNVTFQLLAHNDADIEQQVLDDEPAYLIAVVDDGIVSSQTVARKVLISARGSFSKIDFAGNGSTELESSGFDMFSDTLVPYTECYIGHDEAFEKCGARVKLNFKVSFRENIITLTQQEEMAELKVIKLKPKNVISNVPFDVYPDEVSLEYFNGTGWKRLEAAGNIRNIFSEGNSGYYSIEFTVPDDWEAVPVSGYNGRTLRFVLNKADNCYLRPARHFYPHIEEINLSFTFDDRYAKPDGLISVRGVETFDITDQYSKTGYLTLFDETHYHDTALYLGFESPFDKGPVSIYICVDEKKRYIKLPLRFEYSTRHGFKPLKILDTTKSMTRSGLIMFMPPSDMGMTTELGVERYYIRAVANDNLSAGNYALVNAIDINGVHVCNINTHPEEKLYIDSVVPYPRFKLSHQGILEADVYVNEFSIRTVAERELILKTIPDRVRIEKNLNGDISAFFVKYIEVERIGASDEPRVYELDRMNSEISFGDGIDHFVPMTTDDVAVIVAEVTSDGFKANLDSGSMVQGELSRLYIGSANNKEKFKGGGDIETLDEALLRGANIISGKNRLISKTDYMRAIYAFSDDIDQVACVSGKDAKGNPAKGDITFLLLMKDFMEGPQSFYIVSDKLKKFLTEGCDVTFLKSQLNISEPLFVEISVTCWLKINRIEDAFAIQENMVNEITDYLNPVKNDENNFWKIGTLPTVSQLVMKLNSCKKNSIIRNVSITVRYQDGDVIREKDLPELTVTEYMLPKSGVHKIYVEVAT